MNNGRTPPLNDDDGDIDNLINPIDEKIRDAGLNKGAESQFEEAEEVEDDVPSSVPHGSQGGNDGQAPQDEFKSEFGYDMSKYARPKISPEKLADRSNKFAKTAGHLICHELPKIARHFASFDMRKLEVMAINGEVDLDEKLQIGEDTEMTARAYLTDVNQQVETTVRFDKEIQEGITESIGDLLYENEANIPPASRLAMYAGVGVLSLAATTWMCVLHKNQVMEILADNKVKQDRYKNELEELRARITQAEAEVDEARDEADRLQRQVIAVQNEKKNNYKAPAPEKNKEQFTTYTDVKTKQNGTDYVKPVKPPTKVNAMKKDEFSTPGEVSAVKVNMADVNDLLGADAPF